MRLAASRTGNQTESLSRLIAFGWSPALQRCSFSLSYHSSSSLQPPATNQVIVFFSHTTPAPAPAPACPNAVTGSTRTGTKQTAAACGRPGQRQPAREVRAKALLSWCTNQSGRLCFFPFQTRLSCCPGNAARGAKAFVSSSP